MSKKLRWILPGIVGIVILFIIISSQGKPKSGPSLLPPAPPEPLIANNEQTRYLIFQIFSGAPNPEIPFGYPLGDPPTKDTIAKMVQNIIDTIGTRSTAKAKLGFSIGPVTFDHDDATVTRMIDEAFQIAREKNVAVGIHLDTDMFWEKRTDIYNDDANIEWVNWEGKRNTGLKIEWLEPQKIANRMCYNSPKIEDAVKVRAKFIGNEIKRNVDRLKVEGKGDLFAGVTAGWETHMGQDEETEQFLGFCAMTNRGFSSSKPPKNIPGEVASIVQEFISLWTGSLASAGVSPDKIYSHVAFLSESNFEIYKKEGKVPRGVTYEQVLNFGVSTVDPAAAFGATHRPGFSTYPVSGLFDQIYDEVQKNGNAPWASSEGTNLIPGGEAGNTGIDMETYLARMFNHGAVFVNIFSWGLGGEAMKNSPAVAPFRMATQGEEAIAAYRKFLSQ